MATSKLGFQTKVRPIDEINRDYNDHAVKAGHKTRIVKEIQFEIDAHVARMLEINEEAKKLPSAPPAAEETAEPAATESPVAS